MRRLIFLSCILFPSMAFAHAEEPAAKSITVVDDTWVVHGNIGIVSSADTAGFVCEESFLGGAGYKLIVLGPTEWLTFGEIDVKRTEDGCDFETVVAVDSVVVDAQASPDGNNILFAANGGEGAGLYKSNDRGRTFTNVVFDSDDQQMTGVRFLDDQTAVISAYSRSDTGAGRLYSLDIQTDVLTLLATPADIKFPYVLSAASGRIAWLGRLDSQVIFWGAPETPDEFSTPVESWPTGATLSSDGTQIWVGGIGITGTGLLQGTLATDVVTWETFHPEAPISCVQFQDDTLFTCGLARRDGFDLFSATPLALDGFMKFTDVDGPTTLCPPSSDVGTVCPLVWKELAPYFGKSVPGDDTGSTDIGASDVGGDVNNQDANPIADGSTTTPNPQDGGGCSTAEKDRTHSIWFLIIATLVSVRRRRS